MIMNEYETLMECIQGHIKDCQKQYDTSQMEFYFRGQADKDWRLLPKSIRPEYESVSESSVIEQAKKEGHWCAGQPIVDNIARLQHYGYPTRFLDFTTNIDIALYFACSEREDRDGTLYIFMYTKRAFSNMDSILISELACLKRETPLLDFSRQLIRKYPEYQNKYDDARILGMNILSWIDHGFMITPTKAEMEEIKDTNPRLYNQSGAFYAFGNKTKEPVRFASTIEVPRCVILPEIMDNSDVFRYHQIISVPIPHKEKASIIYMLAQKGIDEKFIYPDKAT